MKKVGEETFQTLLLEDDEGIRLTLEDLLRERNHVVLSYDSPLKCPLLEDSACTCGNKRPCVDFLISDNRMPGMTGLEFVQLQSTRGCKLIGSNKALMSGDWSPEDMQLAESLGCKVFSKPFDFNEFYDWLNHGEKNINLK